MRQIFFSAYGHTHEFWTASFAPGQSEISWPENLQRNKWEGESDKSNTFIQDSTTPPFPLHRLSSYAFDKTKIKEDYPFRQRAILEKPVSLSQEDNPYKIDFPFKQVTVLDKPGEKSI